MKQAGISKLVLILIALVVGLMVWSGLGLGSAYVDYRTNMGFDSFAASTHAPDSLIDDWLPSGTLLATDAEVNLGDGRDGIHVETKVEITFSRGEDSLLATDVLFDGIIDSESGKLESLNILIPDIDTRDDMRAVVQVSLVGSENLFTGIGPCEIFVEAILAAGPGEDEFRIVELSKKPRRLREQGSKRERLHALMDLVHPGNALPEEGLQYQIRTSFLPKWRLGDDPHGPGANRAGLRSNADGYSFDIAANVSSSIDGKHQESSGTTWQNQSTWNDDIW